MDELLSQNHKRLLNIADWTKYIAWVALVLYLLWAASGAAGTYFMQRAYMFQVLGDNTEDVLTVLSRYPAQTISMIAHAAATALQGVVWFLVLKSTSLGLRMIVETNVNYQEGQRQEGQP